MNAKDIKNYDTTKKSKVSTLKQEEVDGVLCVTEEVFSLKRSFDMELFEALNPDKKLIQEVLL
jgi:hypothetical protein